MAKIGIDSCNEMRVSAVLRRRRIVSGAHRQSRGRCRRFIAPQRCRRGALCAAEPCNELMLSTDSKMTSLAIACASNKSIQLDSLLEIESTVQQSTHNEFSAKDYYPCEGVSERASRNSSMAQRKSRAVSISRASAMRVRGCRTPPTRQSIQRSFRRPIQPRIPPKNRPTIPTGGGARHALG